MSEHDDDFVEGRARPARAFTVVGIMLALLALLPFVYARLRGETEPPATPPPVSEGPRPSDAADHRTPSVPGLHGRLVFTTFETRGPSDRQQQIWVLDLATGALAEGPMVPTVEELWVADRDRGWLVLVTADAGAEGVAYLLTGLVPSAEPIELGRGDLISLSTDGMTLLVGRSEPAGLSGPNCPDHRYELNSVSVESGARSSLAEGTIRCGSLVFGTPVDGAALVSVVVDDHPEVWRLPSDGEDVVFPALGYVSRSPRGSLLLVDPEGRVPKALGVWPRTPTGPLLIWPGGGDPRPLVSDVRLYGQRVVAWSPDGGRLVVGGIVEDERNLWLVYAPTGTIVPLFPPNSFPLRAAFSGATFDDRGHAFGGAPGTLVAATDEGVESIELPPGAPSPAGPLAWLP